MFKIIPIEPSNSEELMILVDSGGHGVISFEGNDGKFIMTKKRNEYLFTPIKKQLSEEEELVRQQLVAKNLRLLLGLSH